MQSCESPIPHELPVLSTEQIVPQPEKRDSIEDNTHKVGFSVIQRRDAMLINSKHSTVNPEMLAAKRILIQNLAIGQLSDSLV